MVDASGGGVATHIYWPVPVAATTAAIVTQVCASVFARSRRLSLEGTSSSGPGLPAHTCDQNPSQDRGVI